MPQEVPIIESLTPRRLGLELFCLLFLALFLELMMIRLGAVCSAAGGVLREPDVDQPVFGIGCWGNAGASAEDAV